MENAQELLKDYEVGEAKMLLTLVGNDVLYDRSIGQWYEWQTGRWKAISRESIFAYIDRVVDIYDALLTEYLPSKVQEALIRRRASLNTYRRRLSIVKLAEAYWTQDIRWDDQRTVLPAANGIVNLKTGTLRPYTKLDHYRVIIPTQFSKSQYPLWKQFLSTVFDGKQEIMNYVQRMVGYSLTGTCREHIFPILWGSGRNGKGTFINTIQHVLGPLAGSVNSSLILKPSYQQSGGAPTPELMKLKGKRLVWVSETGESGRLFSSQVKWLSGGDTVVGRNPYGREIEEFRPTHTLLLLTNHRPQADPDDQALWHRVRLIPFTMSFVPHPKKKNERKMVVDLDKQLQEESSGILSWMVKGCLDYWKHGLATPKEVEAATEDYRDKGDSVWDFIHEEVEESGGSRIKALDLYGYYQKWCHARGLKHESNTKFGMRMNEVAKKTRYSWGYEYQGVRLRPRTVDLRPSSFQEDPENV